jgi:pSer/pThr/pTyr-binding forkhead associated (FHA) protein
VIVCPRCSKENQDHYKFCLGCGAELPRDAAHAPKSFTAPTPPAGVQAAPPGGFGAPPQQQQRPGGGFGGPAPQAGFGAPAGGFGAPAAAPAPAAPAPAAAAPSDQVKCGTCGNMNNRNFKFCGTCGSPLAAAPAPAAPAAAPVPMAAPVQSGGAPRGTLVLIRADGSEGDSFPLLERTAIGRESGGLFASDSYLSPRHATLAFGPQGLMVTDEGSLNGVYMRIAADTPTELRDRSIFRIGQEIIRLERFGTPATKDGVELMGSPTTGYIGRICLIIGRETNGNCYAIPQGGLHLGRERGDILFPDDGYVSGLHCRIHEEGGRVLLTDVGSSNGTFVRISAPVPVPAGSMVLFGQQLFRVEY